MNSLGIDVGTFCVEKIIRRLKNLKSTEDVRNGGRYHADESYSQILIRTTKTEEELDEWLYETKFGDCEIIGTFKR